MNFKTYFLLVGFLLLAGCDSSISTSGSSVGLPVSNDPKITFSGPTYTKVNSCYPLFVSSISGIEKSPVIQSTDLKVNFSSNAANQNLLYKDSSCASAVDSTIIGQGGYQSLLFFKAAATDVVVITGSTEYGLIVDPFQFSSFSGANQSAATSVSVYGPTNSFVNECTPFVALLTNNENAFITPSQNVVVNLSGNDVGYFYSDASCGNLVTTATIVSESTSTSFYFKSGFNKNYILQAQATGLTPALANVNIAGLAAGSGNTNSNSNTSNTNSATRLLITGASNHSANSCSSFAVILADSTSQPYAAPANVAITLAASNAGTFYSDATCSTSAPITISAGQSSAVFYFDTALSASFILKAQAANYAMAVFPVTFSSTSTNLATALELSGLTTLDSDQCAPFAVSALNNAGIATNTSSLLAVNLSAKNAGLFFSDSTCATGVTSATIASGKSVGYFYYKNNLKTSDLITTDNNALAEATLAIKINAAPVVPAAATPKIIISGVPNIQTGQCSALSVVSTDSSGNPLNVSANLNVNFLGMGSGTFYQNSNCSTTTTSVQITSGSSLATFYFKSASAENLSLSTQASGYLATSFPLQVLSVSQQPVALKIVGAISINSNVCIPFTINAIDSNGTNIVSASSIAVTLANIGGTGTFYSDACSTATSTVTINSGNSYASFYYRNTTAQNSLMTASATGLGVATLPITVNNSTSPAIGFKITGMSALGLNTCSPYVITSVDVNGFAQSVLANTSITLSGNGNGGNFYSNNTCTTVSSTVTINQNTSFQVFYFKDGSAENLVLLANATNFSLGSLAVNVASPTTGGSSSGSGGSTGSGSPLSPVMFGISGPPNVLAGACSGPYTLSVMDAYGVLSSGSVNKTVSIISGSVTSNAYTDNTCGTTLTSLIMLSGSNTQQFYLMDTQAESITIQASEPSLITATMSVNSVQPGVLAISGGPLGPWQAFYYNGNGALVDQVLTVTNVGQTQTLNLQASGSLTSGFSYKGGTFPGQGGSCTAGLNLASGAKCTLVVRFQPSSASNFATSLQISFSDGTNTKTSSMSLSGQGNSNLTVKQIAAGGNHTCFLYSDMTVKCFGNNTNGQLGVGSTTNVGQTIGSTDFAQTTPIISNAVQIVAGDSHNCALTTAGDIYCWGSNSYGQLGIGSASDVGSSGATITSPFTKVNLGTGRTAVQITTGAFHTCALLDNSTIKCWGNNTYGQLGYEDVTNRGTSAGQMGDSLLAVNLGTGLTPISIAAGGYHSCALFNTGAIKCWGYNSYGQLGLGDATNRGDIGGTMGNNLSTSNLGGIKVQALTLGLYHTCAIVAVPNQINNAVKCWGRNNSGQLGYGDTNNRGTSITQLGGNLLLLPLPSSINPIMMGAGRTHTCMMTDSGFVYCWGGNGSGQLGIDSTSTVNNASMASSIYLSSVSLASNVGVGGNHNCVLLQNSVVKCWGDNAYGQLALRQGSTLAPNWGNSTSRSMASLPETKAATFGYVVDVSMTNQQTCAIWKSGDISCWGIPNNSGRVYGSNSVAGATAFSFNQAATKILPVDGNATGFCFLTANNQIKCWGDNNSGNINPPVSTSYYPENPLTLNLPGGTALKSATTNYGNPATCYLSSNGTIYCGGYNDVGGWGLYFFSNLLSGCGGNTYCYNTSSWGTLGVSNATDIAFSYATGCAVISDGSVKCWGYNSNGEGGNGGTSIISSGVNTISTAISGGTATSVQMGYSHTCVLLSSGRVTCWGVNGNGQLGTADGSSAVHGPTAVSLGTVSTGTFVATQLVAGYNFNCALATTGQVKCWGSNSYGQLGLENSTTYGLAANTMGTNLPFTKLPPDFNATKLYTNNNSQHVCASGYLNNNPFLVRLYCWGRNDYFQLGDGTTNSRGVSANQMGWYLPAISNSSTQISDINSSDYRGPGNYTYTVPDGVNQIFVQTWGGGGAGGSYNGTYYGGQGGGGAYATKVYNVSPGQTFSVAVGNGAKSSYYGAVNGYFGPQASVGGSSFSSLTAGGGKTVSSSSSANGVGGTYNGADWGSNGLDGGSSYNSIGNLSNYGGSYLGGLGGFFLSLGGEYPGGAGATCYNSGMASCYLGGVGADGRVLVTAVSNYIPAGSSGGNASGAADYTVPGVYIYKTPSNSYSVRVQIWGGGGGGGGVYYDSGSTRYCGSGGGAGGYVDYVFNINPGQSIYVNVGAGATGGGYTTTNPTQAPSGAASSVGLNGITLTAFGGYGGVATTGSSCTTSSPYYCQGGNATGGYTNIVGGAGYNMGGWAFNGSWSSNPSGAGGNAYLGGMGGTSIISNSSQNGNNGGFPGGGGSGSCASGSGYYGGAGGNGRVTITPQ